MFDVGPQRAAASQRILFPLSNHQTFLNEYLADDARMQSDNCQAQSRVHGTNLVPRVFVDGVVQERVAFRGRGRRTLEPFSGATNHPTVVNNQTSKTLTTNRAKRALA